MSILSCIRMILSVPVICVFHLVGDALVRILWLAHLPERIFWLFNCVFGYIGIAILRVFFGLRVMYSGQCQPHTFHKGPFIIVANHNSTSDMAVLTKLCGTARITWVSRPGLQRRIPYYSFVLRQYSGCFLHRGAREQNILRLRALGQRALRENRGVIIFPEGRKRKDTYQQLLKFQRDGLTALLEGAQGATLLPVAITGSGQFLPAA